MAAWATCIKNHFWLLALSFLAQDAEPRSSEWGFSFSAGRFKGGHDAAAVLREVRRSYAQLIFPSVKIRCYPSRNVMSASAKSRRVGWAPAG